MTDTAAPISDGSAQSLPYGGDVQVFVPHAKTLPPVGPYLRDAWDRRHFVVAMAKADLRGPRSRTGLGELWAIADPLFQALVYWFVINTIRSGPGRESDLRLIILVSGIFLFTFSSTVVGGGGHRIGRGDGRGARAHAIRFRRTALRAASERSEQDRNYQQVKGHQRELHVTTLPGFPSFGVARRPDHREINRTKGGTSTGGLPPPTERQYAHADTQTSTPANSP